MDSQASPNLTAVVLLSLVFHALLVFGLNSGARAAQPARPQPVRITVHEAPRPQPKPPEPVAEAPEAPAPAAVVARAPRVRAAKEKAVSKSESPEPAPQPAAAPPALDFTGVTLTSPHGGFAQVAGNGERMEGPLGASPSSARQGRGQGTGGGKGELQNDGLVARSSLSRAPRAPSLDDALAANYPAKAHDLGRSGEAVVRARILADGMVSATSVIVASAPEFGKACQRTLQGSRWSAPLDKSGRPVATELSYKCVFEVTR